MNILRYLLLKIKFLGKNFKNRILSPTKNNHQILQKNKDHDDKNSKFLHTMKIKIKSIITHELLILFGSFGEIFFAFFILFYAFYPNVLTTSLIFLGVIGIHT